MVNGEIWLKHAPKYNPNPIIYLDMISELIGILIQHALNGGEKKFVRYWVDGYIEKYNICIEWDEKHHNSKKVMEYDKKRDLFLTEKFGCNIIRIKEKDFLNNVVDEGFKVIIKINEIIDKFENNN
jgi:very-short-patch-repair endonuclease